MEKLWADRVKRVRTVAGGVLVGTVTAVTLAGCSLGKHEQVKIEGGAVTIPLAKLAEGKAKFYKTTYNGKDIVFFTVKTSEGTYRTAFDACDSCYKDRKGYEQRSQCHRRVQSWLPSQHHHDRQRHHLWERCHSRSKVLLMERLFWGVGHHDRDHDCLTVGEPGGQGWRLMERQTVVRCIVLVSFLVGVSLLHYSTPLQLPYLHAIYQRLYYLPIILAALWFGLRGGVACALLASLAYAPHVLFQWGGAISMEMEKYLEIVLYNMVGNDRTARSAGAGTGR